MTSLAFYRIFYRLTPVKNYFFIDIPSIQQPLGNLLNALSVGIAKTRSYANHTQCVIYWHFSFFGFKI